MIVREFRLTHMAEGAASSSEPRSLKHFHYVGWPDFGVPDRPQVNRFFSCISSRRRLRLLKSLKATVVPSQLYYDYANLKIFESSKN